MLEKLPKFSQLSEIKQKAVRLKAEGVTLDAISAEIRRPKPTIEDWVLPHGSCAEEVEEYRGFLAERQIEAVEDLQKVCQADAKAAWERLKAIAMSEDSNMPKHVSLAAVDSMLDRAGVARVSKTEGKVGLTVTDEDRAKRFREIAELQADIKPEQLLRLAGKV